MSAKRILTLITLILFVVTAVSCVSSCKHSRPDGLRFVGRGKLEPAQSTESGLVVVTHGWIEKGRGGWPEDMAIEIHKRVEPNLWLCGYFDWSTGAKAFNPTDAAEYARDIAGPELAGEIIKLGSDLQHIHLIGHSSGCWAISEAAKRLAGETKADLHLTFLDAYIPAFWEESLLGNVNAPAKSKCWAEHYYTRDYTLGWTQQDLSGAHNVDVTNIDQMLKDHNFPWKWYYTTVSGKYPEDSFLDNRRLVWMADGIEYGFARSLEAADAGSWDRSLKLPTGNEAVRLRKKE